MGKSWRTTTAGILAVAGALIAAAQALLDGNPATNPDWAAVGAAIVAGFGLIAAKDFNVSGSGPK